VIQSVTDAVTGAIAVLLSRCHAGVTRLRAVAATLVSATLGAIGFLTRLPVGTTDCHWMAFRRQPAAMVPVAIALGAILAVPLVVGLPAPTAAFCVPIWLVLWTGITHLDGLADLADAAVVHGDATRRRSVMRDTTVGVGAVAAATIAIAGLVLAAHTLADVPSRVAFAVVVVAEVSAKLGMVAIAALGSATHEGLGSALVDDTGPLTFVVGLAWIPPVTVGLWWIGGESVAIAAVVALGVALASTGALFLWARRNLGGVSGDVFGATNELARLAALHAGLLVWTHVLADTTVTFASAELFASLEVFGWTL